MDERHRAANESLFPAIAIPLFVLVCGLLSYLPGRPPRPLGPEADPSLFSSVRAAEVLKSIATRPHPIGSPAHDEVRDILEARLRPLVDEVSIQRSEVVSDYRRRGGTVVMARVENLVARVRGTHSRGAVLVMCHYDSVPSAPGAADDGSGVAAILETLRALSLGPPLRNDLIVLLSDGEEAGLLGAQAFFRDHPWRGEIRMVINLEARGTGGPVLMFETSSGNGRLIREFAAAVPHPMANSLAYEIYRRMPNDTDLSIAKRAGHAGLNMAFSEGLYDYHSAGDSPPNLSLASLQQMGESALGLSRRFGNLDLETLKAPDAVYFNPFDSWILVYPPWINWLAAGFFILLYAWALWRGLRAGTARPADVARSAVAYVTIFVLTVEASALLLALVRQWIVPAGLADWRMLLGERGTLIGQVWLVVACFAFLYGWLERGARFWQVSILAALPIVGWAWVGDLRWPLAVLNPVLALMFFAASRRGAGGSSNPAIGILGLWGMGFVLLAAFLPGGAYLFGWSLLFALPVHAWAAGRRSGGSDRRMWSILLLGALPGGILMADLAFLAHMNLGNLVPWIAAIPLGLLLGLVVPLFAAAGRRPRRGLASVAAILALVFLATPLVSSFDTRHRQPAELFYLSGLDAGEGAWATTDRSLSPWQEEVMGPPIQVSAETIIPGWRGRLLLSAPRPAKTAAPGIEPISAVKTEQGERIEFRLVPSAGAARLVLLFSAMPRVESAKVNGIPLPITPGPEGSWRWVYSAPPPEGLRIRLEGRGLGSASLRVVQSTYGWPPGLQVPERPPTLMSNPRGVADSTVVVREWALSDIAAGPAPAP